VRFGRGVEYGLCRVPLVVTTEANHKEAQAGQKEAQEEQTTVLIFCVSFVPFCGDSF
jgi:hypothetical protein